MSKNNDKRVARAVSWCLEELNLNYVGKMDRDGAFDDMLEDAPVTLDDFESGSKVSDLMKRKDVQGSLKTLVETLFGYVKETAERVDEDPDAYDPDMIV